MNRLKQGTVMFWVLIIVVLAGVALYLLPSMFFSDQPYPIRIACASNLKQLGLGMKMYAGDHGEIYPNKLVDSGEYLGFQSALFVCDGSGNKPGPFETADEWTDYIYVSGLPESVHPSTVLMYCPAKNHRDKGGNVLFADGHVEWFNSKHTKDFVEDESSFEGMIRAIREQRKK